jgi:tyrosinase
MDTGTYGITGLPRPNNAIPKTKNIPYVPNLPLRHEISDLANSTDPEVRKQWTLFVLALERFKDKPVEDKLSYFQVAGIVSFCRKSC